jgi:2-keto-4-pentenoate hydratase
MGHPVSINAPPPLMLWRTAVRCAVIVPGRRPRISNRIEARRSATLNASAARVTLQETYRAIAKLLPALKICCEIGIAGIF